MQIVEQVQDRPKAGNIKAQWVSLWTGPAVGAVLVIAMLAFPGFWPPMSPTMSADEVASFYAEHTAWMRFSQVTFNLCGVMVLPFFMVIAVQMKRMKQTHVFAYCYLTAVVSGVTIFALSNILFLVAAFRPDRSPELVMLLNDLAWIVLIAPIGMVVSQFVVLALAVYFDDGPDPVFPGGWATIRWPPPWRWFPQQVPLSSTPDRWPGMDSCRSGCATARSRRSWW